MKSETDPAILATRQAILRFSPLGKRVYVVTRYTDHGAYLTAHTKYDVTDDFNRIIAERALDAFDPTRPTPASPEEHRED